MKKTVKHITLYSIRIFLMVFWLYVALDKLWDLPQFHSALLRQPFPNRWADILFWLLPLTEFGIALLVVLTTGRVPAFYIKRRKKSSLYRLPTKSHPTYKQRSAKATSRLGLQIVQLLTHIITPYLLSALLLSVFSIYIALGVLGLYEERPCGCASVFSGLSWSWHLPVNLALVGISILGWYLTGPTAPIERYSTHEKQVQLFVRYLQVIKVQLYQIILSRVMVFKMLFAPFPGRPVRC